MNIWSLRNPDSQKIVKRNKFRSDLNTLLPFTDTLIYNVVILYFFELFEKKTAEFIQIKNFHMIQIHLI